MIATAMETFEFPYYHLVPKDPVANAQYRQTVIQLAIDDDAVKEDLWIRCRRDELYFFNTFLFTFDPRMECPAIPFITYEFQDETLHKMKRYWGRKDLLIEKSRDMGASWISLGFIFHRWMFWDLQSVLIGSRKEEYVDKRGDKKSLFAKLDFFIEHLPPWMIPAHTRTKLHLLNEFNGSSIDGESTNSDFGRGDRRTIVFCDEFASVENGYEVESATRDVTDSRWYNSTPKGVGNAFHEKRSNMSERNPEQVIRLHWSKHPKKAEGLYTSVDTGGGRFTLKIIDESYPFPPGYHFILDGKTRSPWYDLQCERAANQQEIAQELDIDYAKSGWQWFGEVHDIIQRDARQPVAVGDLIYDPDNIRQKPKFMPNPGGMVKLWVDINVDNDFDRTEEYAVGVDVALGTAGDYSSNSAASIVGRFTGRKIAEVTTNSMSPEEWADFCIAACYFFHGSEEKLTAYLIWENNGPGTQFSKRIKRRSYKKIYYRRNELSDSEKETDIAGWHSNRESKKFLLGEYADAIKQGLFRNPSEAALLEMSEYIHHPNGDIVHSRSNSLKDIDPTSSGENHGDRVIADALAWRGRADNVFREVEVTPRTPPPGSMAYRIEMRKKRERERSDSWRN